MGQIFASKSSLSLQNSGIQDFSNGQELVLGVVSYFAPRTVCLILVTNDSKGTVVRVVVIPTTLRPQGRLMRCMCKLGGNALKRLLDLPTQPNY